MRERHRSDKFGGWLCRTGAAGKPDRPSSLVGLVGKSVGESAPTDRPTRTGFGADRLLHSPPAIRVYHTFPKLSRIGLLRNLNLEIGNRA